MTFSQMFTWAFFIFMLPVLLVIIVALIATIWEEIKKIINGE